MIWSAAAEKAAPRRALQKLTRDANGKLNGFDIAADFSMGKGTGRVARLHFTKQ